ncbi:elongation factor P maturation arginine rhamnosyltransferase EarP [Aromatoleum evansii]|uniref:Protein-arginine rhamnosyltransferase n=1 Tax=Aromatoleum evansii TaxID=59406 RepID=A0ABZ1AM05_AROEV|nr:elongation factor P maturation arginine rhamnosyltransferase EarP [Aromatoleum evansii]
MSLADAAPAFDWDIFCRVVDNFGDIGVCWRLAKALAHDHGCAVRLWVDDWGTFARLCPAAADAGDAVRAEGVEVRRWREPFPEVLPARAVVEAFACEPPASYVEAMAAATPRPHWINLEYLSAEDWIEGCHGLASPHPRLPLAKRFCFPGFTARSGGLLRERGLLDARDRFQADAIARRDWLAGRGIPVPAEGARLVSLFAYEQPQLPELLRLWAGAPRPTLLLVPEGRVLGDVLRFFGRAEARAGAILAAGALSTVVLPFLDTADYDRLLWACELNFVRGEDSFVRAQWAARPFVWHIYEQDEAVHHDKLDAFLARYLAGLDEAASDATRAFWRAWNGEGSLAAAWPAFADALPQLVPHARRWSDGLAALQDLASTLVQFSELTVK